MKTSFLRKFTVVLIVAIAIGSHGILRAESSMNGGTISVPHKDLPTGRAALWSAPVAADGSRRVIFPAEVSRVKGFIPPPRTSVSHWK